MTMAIKSINAYVVATTTFTDPTTSPSPKGHQSQRQHHAKTHPNMFRPVEDAAD
jgi:hypothetical protein